MKYKNWKDYEDKNYLTELLEEMKFKGFYDTKQIYIERGDDPYFWRVLHSYLFLKERGYWNHKKGQPDWKKDKTKYEII